VDDVDTEAATMTTRRNFLSSLLTAGAAFAVLPPATTYSRVWRAARAPFDPSWEWMASPWSRYESKHYQAWRQILLAGYPEFKAPTSRPDPAVSRAFVKQFFGV